MFDNMRHPFSRVPCYEPSESSMRVKLILINAIVVATVGGILVSGRDSVRTLVIEACSGMKNAAACADSPPLIRAIDLLAPDGRTCDPSRQISSRIGTLPLDVPAAVANKLAAPSPPATRRRPNIVFLLADDFSFDLIPCMPHVLQMVKDGASFANYFVTDSLCCPSRASIFTGRLPHNTGIYTNTEPNGGFIEFLKRGHEEATFATALAAAGYRTAMLGKYLNNYEPRNVHVAHGWNEWDVAGDGYRGFDYELIQNHRVVHYANRAKHYLTDVLSERAVNFIKQTSGAPFMIEIATFAPHVPSTPAPRDAYAFPRSRAPRTAAFNAASDVATPKWLSSLPPLSNADTVMIDAEHRKRAQAVLAIDAMIGAIQAAVANIGAADNTYFVFSSDNGYHMGEHRLMPGKLTPYDTDIHVPLIVTGPGIPAGLTITEIAENIDIAPTFIDLGSAKPLPNADGLSLVELLHGRKIQEGRKYALIEHQGPVRAMADPDFKPNRSGNPTTYEALRSVDALYVEYSDGDREYHDLAADPYELRNTYASLTAERKAELHALMEEIGNCRGATECSVSSKAEGQ
jgi:N-acetylglucosamine-6-sulfatase